jgi:hypothetical protein
MITAKRFVAEDGMKSSFGFGDIKRPDSCVPNEELAHGRIVAQTSSTLLHASSASLPALRRLAGRSGNGERRAGRSSVVHQPFTTPKASEV